MLVGNEFGASSRSPRRTNEALPPHGCLGDPPIKLRRARATGLSYPGSSGSDAGRYCAPASELVFGRSNSLQALPLQRDISERAPRLHRPAMAPPGAIISLRLIPANKAPGTHRSLIRRRTGFAQVFSQPHTCRPNSARFPGLHACWGYWLRAGQWNGVPSSSRSRDSFDQSAAANAAAMRISLGVRPIRSKGTAPKFASSNATSADPRRCVL